MGCVKEYVLRNLWMYITDFDDTLFSLLPLFPPLPGPLYFFLKNFLLPFYSSNLYSACERKHEVFLSELSPWCRGITFPMSFRSDRWHWSQSTTEELLSSKPHLPWARLKDPVVFSPSHTSLRASIFPEWCFGKEIEVPPCKWKM